MGKDPDKKKKSYRKKQNRNLGQNGTALEAIEKVRCIFKINTVGRHSDTCVSLFFTKGCSREKNINQDQL